MTKKKEYKYKLAYYRADENNENRGQISGTEEQKTSRESVHYCIQFNIGNDGGHGESFSRFIRRVSH